MKQLFSHRIKRAGDAADADYADIQDRPSLSTFFADDEPCPQDLLAAVAEQHASSITKSTLYFAARLSQTEVWSPVAGDEVWRTTAGMPCAETNGCFFRAHSLSFADRYSRKRGYGPVACEGLGSMKESDPVAGDGRIFTAAGQLFAGDGRIFTAAGQLFAGDRRGFIAGTDVVVEGRSRRNDKIAACAGEIKMTMMNSPGKCPAELFIK